MNTKEVLDIIQRSIAGQFGFGAKILSVVQDPKDPTNIHAQVLLPSPLNQIYLNLQLEPEVNQENKALLRDLILLVLPTPWDRWRALEAWETMFWADKPPPSGSDFIDHLTKVCESPEMFATQCAKYVLDPEQVAAIFEWLSSG